MNLVSIGVNDADRIAPLVAGFRTTLNSYKGIVSEPDLGAAKEESYIVCRIEEPCLWVEHIFVREEYRRKGAATLLFGKAEEIAESMGEDTVYNFVHPNNEGMIRFLRSKGYTVLNMIEIRKPYRGEKPATTIHVEKEAFDY